MSNCRCAEPCFYCGETVPDHHDHDHFPVPYRHGGMMTLAACYRCHNLKERVPFDQWPPAALEAVKAGMDGLPPSVALILVAFESEGWDAPNTPDELAPFIEQFVDACSTPEARIAAAKTFCVILDRNKRRADEQAESGEGRTTA